MCVCAARVCPTLYIRFGVCGIEVNDEHAGVLVCVGWFLCLGLLVESWLVWVCLLQFAGLGVLVSVLVCVAWFPCLGWLVHNAGWFGFACVTLLV